MPPHQYHHMCRTDHIEVGFRDTDDDERCPVCRALDRAAHAEGALKEIIAAGERDLTPDGLAPDRTVLRLIGLAQQALGKTQP
jgi:hypothetical protein